MQFRNKYLVSTVRILLGILLLFSGIGGYYSALHHMSGVPQHMIGYMQALWDTGIFQIIKTTEIMAGLMFVLGFLPWLASLVIAPLCVGIIVVNARVSPESLPIGILPALFNSYLGYVYWDKYKALFAQKE